MVKNQQSVSCSGRQPNWGRRNFQQVRLRHLQSRWWFPLIETISTLLILPLFRRLSKPDAFFHDTLFYIAVIFDRRGKHCFLVQYCVHNRETLYRVLASNSFKLLVLFIFLMITGKTIAEMRSEVLFHFHFKLWILMFLSLPLFLCLT